MTDYGSFDCVNLHFLKLIIITESARLRKQVVFVKT